MYGFGRYLVLATLLHTSLNSPDVRTSQQVEPNDKVMSGSLVVFPTRTSRISDTRSTHHPTLETSASQTLSEISVDRTADTPTGLDYGPNIEQNFNDLTRNYYELVVPTTTTTTTAGVKVDNTAALPSTSWRITSTGSGEGAGAPRSRGLSLLEPLNNISTVPLVQSVPRLDNRKTSPDIREFITGFVKYLNGNVPPPMTPIGRPVRTRINNRGPPKIADLPPLLLDPAPPPSLMPPPPPLIQQHPTHEPPPYPFEKPIDTQHIIKPFVSGVPLPEQLVPTTEPTTTTTRTITTSTTTTTTTTAAPISLRPPLRPTRPKPTEKNENKTKEISKIFVEPTAITSKPATTTPTTTQQSKSNITTKVPEINATKVLGLGVSSTVTLVTEPTTTTKSLTNITTNNSTDSAKTHPSTNKTNSTVTLTTAAPNSNVSTTEQELSTKISITSTTSMKPTSTKQNITEKPLPSRVIPAIESSIVEEIPIKGTDKPTKWEQTPLPTKSSSKVSGSSNSYVPRPGIVLDDPEYKPGIKPRPIVTAPSKGEIFDVTVSAVHGASNTGKPQVYPVELEGVNLPGAGNGEVSVITTAEEGQHFVSIDGKRTYISLFGSTETSGIKPTTAHKHAVKTTAGMYGGGPQEGRPKRPYHHRRPPQQPPVRIDTCIVGDWSTCDTDQHEICRTDQGVSSCHCAPGYSKHSHRQPCKRVVSVVASVQVEKIYEHKLTWSEKLKDRESQEYLQLEYEANRALESAMSMTPFSDAFMGSKLNNIYTIPGAPHKPVFINLTLQIEESTETLRPQIKGEIQKQLLGAIHRRSNNIGTSPLWATAANSVSHLQDLDECQSPDLNDCHIAATCKNIFGSFECTCPNGYKDEFSTNPHKSGRRCETCSSEHCNHRGTCSYSNGIPVCQCVGNYYGSQCEVDGEVLGVAIGASVAAVIIILSTLACLCMWSRRWNKEQKIAGIGSPVFGYMPSGGSTVKTPGVGAPPYQVSLEDRLRWAQIADVMAQSTNHYAPEPVGIPTRPSSAMFGYGGTLPIAPMPLPRLGLRPGSAHNTRQDSSSEEEDRTDLLGRNFQVPRPKSRSSIANQSGIYYDVDYEQQTDHFNSNKHPGCIALNTYTMGRSHYYRT
ncbi:calcium-binding EGF-like domain-containing protein pawn isoform X2 [Rhodnius prolixus]|uniref:calcium-binding EGF-like domain-containing protein pawn isoform X2 n=1 Tax=Rhodnius prolixus TaxID=13249 RepID=UPI003D18D118